MGFMVLLSVIWHRAAVYRGNSPLGIIAKVVVIWKMMWWSRPSCGSAHWKRSVRDIRVGVGVGVVGKDESQNRVVEFLGFD